MNPFGRNHCVEAEGEGRGLITGLDAVVDLSS